MVDLVDNSEEEKFVLWEVNVKRNAEANGRQIELAQSIQCFVARLEEIRILATFPMRKDVAGAIECANKHLLFALHTDHTTTGKIAEDCQLCHPVIMGK